MDVHVLHLVADEVNLEAGDAVVAQLAIGEDPVGFGQLLNANGVIEDGIATGLVKADRRL